MNVMSLFSGQRTMKAPSLEETIKQYIRESIYESQRPLRDAIAALVVKMDEMSANGEQIPRNTRTEAEVKIEMPDAKIPEVVIDSKYARKEIHKIVMDSARTLELTAEGSWSKLYDYASLDIGFHPYLIGKETKSGKKCEKNGRYIQTVENRGKLLILLEAARRWSRQHSK